jgi:hypothetical protein
MQSRFISSLILVMALLAAAIPSLGQDSGKAGQPASPPALFNPQTVEVFKGIVVAAPVVPKGGLPEPVHFTLKTDRETITVLLGPNWFIESQGFQIAPLDQVEVRGSRLLLEGKNAVVAAEVRKGDAVLKLRGEQGAPLWGGRGRN